MGRLIDDWVDIKGDITAHALASVQFNKDQSFLRRLKAFRFKKFELLVELYPSDKMQSIDIMRLEEFESLQDRLLIYTSSTNATPIMIKTQMNKWSNEEVLHFFENEFTSSTRIIIDHKEREMILKIMHDRALSGSDLFDKHLAFNSFSNLFGDLDADDTRKDIVLMELFKIIQIQWMKAEVNDLVAKFDIATQIQKLRRIYFDQD
eukprot:740925_1